MESDEGRQAIEAAKKLVMEKHHYSDAINYLKFALELNPSSEFCFGMLIIAETLYYGEIELLPISSIDWYSILHLPCSALDEEVVTRYEDLMYYTASSSVRSFPGAMDANLLIRLAFDTLCDKSKRSDFDSRRKACVTLEWPSCKEKSYPPEFNRRNLTRKRYVDWKPPIYGVGVCSSRKRRKNDGFSCPSCCNEVEGDPSLASELRVLKKKVFDEMPQSPHYSALSKYNANLREGMILGLELAFAKLAEEIKNVVDPEMFLARYDDFNMQISALEEMGYNVVRLRLRLGTLKTYADRKARSSRGEIWTSRGH